MRDAEIRGNKPTSLKKEPARTTRSEPRPTYVRPKFDPHEIDLMHPLSKTTPAISESKVEKTQQALAKKPTSRSLQKPVLFFAIIALLSTAGFVGYRAISSQKDQGAQQSSESSSAGKYTIPFYEPKNLSAEYTYNNDVKMLKKDVYYYTINGPDNTVFHVTQQLIPESFDFAAFNKKFLNPEKFTTEAGSVVVGPVGSSIIGSIQTQKNSWIIVNSENPSVLSNTQTVLRSFKQSL